VHSFQKRKKKGGVGTLSSNLRLLLTWAALSALSNSSLKSAAEKRRGKKKDLGLKFPGLHPIGQTYDLLLCGLALAKRRGKKERHKPHLMLIGRGETPWPASPGDGCSLGKGKGGRGGSGLSPFPDA